MKNLIYILALILTVISCEKPYNKKPADLLSKTEMTDLLTDLYIDQQILNFSPPNAEYSLRIAENTLSILKNHNVDKQVFEDSYKYYYTNPEAYQEILEKVKENIKGKLSEEGKKALETSEANIIEEEQ
jgi:hypothetical protein